MNLVDIEGYEGLYAFDLNTNQVWSYKKKIYLKLSISNSGYGYYYLYINTKKKCYLSHRLVYQYNNLDIDITNLYIDHIDRNRLNNDLHNLRTATNSENCCNRKTPITNKSTGLKNISTKSKNSYNVKIIKNKIKYYKTFKKLEDAIEWRDFKLKEIHKNFSSI
jgi:hypothetical protein